MISVDFYCSAISFGRMEFCFPFLLYISLKAKIISAENCFNLSFRRKLSLKARDRALLN